jgi:hypothetical protein
MTNLRVALKIVWEVLVGFLLLCLFGETEPQQ